MPYQVLPFISQRPVRPGQFGGTPAQAGERTRIIVSAHERLVVTYSEHDHTVYLFCQPGEDPVAVLGAGGSLGFPIARNLARAGLPGELPYTPAVPAGPLGTVAAAGQRARRATGGSPSTRSVRSGSPSPRSRSTSRSARSRPGAGARGRSSS